MSGLFLCLTFVCGCMGFYVSDDRFMSDINLEQYYVLEENALSNADILLREDYFGAEEGEDEEVHLKHAPNLTSFADIIDETKSVHRLAGPNLDQFLANPVNIYHLIRRLDNGWRQSIDLMLQAKPCKRWNLHTISERLLYLKRNLPSQRELLRVLDYIASLQTLYKLSPQDIARGKVGDTVSIKPLDLEEQFNIVKVFHDKEKLHVALKWLEHILRMMIGLNSTELQELSFKVSDVLNMMASEYYQMKNFEEAKRITEKILEIDPANPVAENNLKFFSNKINELKDKDLSNKGKPLPRKISKIEKICARKRTKKLLRKSCKLLQYGILFYKMEIIRKKPYIVLFHDVIRNTTATALKNMAHESMTENSWVFGVKFKYPSVNVEVTTEMLYKNPAKRHLRRLNRYLDSIMLADNRKPLLTQNLQLMNVGLEGSDLKNHLAQLRLKSTRINFKPTAVGAYFTFLNEVKTGGEVVFPDLGIKIHPDMGSVLFYQVKPPTVVHSFCPVVGSTLWVAVKGIHEKEKDFCIDEDAWL